MSNKYQIVDDSFSGSYSELMTREEIDAAEKYWREESEHPFNLVWNQDETEVHHQADDGTLSLVARIVK